MWWASWPWELHSKKGISLVGQILLAVLSYQSQLARDATREPGSCGRRPGRTFAPNAGPPLELWNCARRTLPPADDDAAAPTFARICVRDTRLRQLATPAMQRHLAGRFAPETDGDEEEQQGGTYLPPSEVGSPRYLRDRCADALAVHRKRGKAVLFINMTTDLGPGPRPEGVSHRS